MTGLAGPLNVAVEAGGAFDRAGVRWVLVGALAASLHGVARQTHDVDVVIEAGPEQADALYDALSPRFFVDRRALAAALRDRGSLSLVHPATMTRVDVFVVRDEELARAQIERRVMFRVYTNDAVLPVLSAEDTVLQSLQWHRRTGRRAPRQWADAVGVLRSCAATLDRNRLRVSAARAKLSSLLGKAWQESAEPPRV